MKHFMDKILYTYHIFDFDWNSNDMNDMKLLSTNFEIIMDQK